MTEQEQPRPVVKRRKVLARLVGALRSRRGITQVRLGQELGLSQSAIDRLETGASSITTETLQDLGVAMGTTGSFLLCLLEALTEDLTEDGYAVIPSPPRRSKEEAGPPVPGMTDAILVAHVTLWLEGNRALSGFEVSGSVGGSAATASPVDGFYRCLGQGARGPAAGGYQAVAARVLATPT